MSSILIVYSTVDGHTRRICQHLRQVIERLGHRVTLVSVEDADEVDPGVFDKIVLGASVRYGRHRRNVLEFINANRQVLESRPSALFSVNIVARKPDKNQPDTNPYLKKLLGKIAWRPDRLAVFAGKLDYPSYRFRDRQIIRLIMWMTKGPTDPATVAEFTDWQQVEAFGREIGTLQR